MLRGAPLLWCPLFISGVSALGGYFAILVPPCAVLPAGSVTFGPSVLPLIPVSFTVERLCIIVLVSHDAVILSSAITIAARIEVCKTPYAGSVGLQRGD